MKTFATIASFFCIWISSFINSEYEVLLGFLLILSVGILHGSNDLLLISKIETSIFGKKYLTILATYIVWVVIALVLFQIAPLFALSLFILVSAYHFGEQNWEEKNYNLGIVLKSLFVTAYGIFILFLLFYLNDERVLKIVYTITGEAINSVVIDYIFYSSFILLSITWVICAQKDSAIKSRSIVEIFNLLVFALIFTISPLVWGFAIYFIFWHSLPSLKDQIIFLYKDSEKKSILSYLKTAFPIWLVSIVGLLILYYFFKDLDIFYGLFFSVLAAVTFPHSLIIFKMFRR